MATTFSVDTASFRVDIDALGSAHLVFQAASGVPVTDSRGYAYAYAYAREGVVAIK
ncbi:hypothetical protein RGU70_08795 [Herbaspirillum sp. RTI4]|uniref:hypothetical protein n=1 Tax=Herbaspirillum sp. RTI4 TaxID=3048640 RepID=UPI002AB54D9F|nr:hypothetical protein [Herbaspirillum sp. RTI4]MDY7578419.1 hypothetical protein [Herbaspirillum sp. RTI4]MEA9982567.1 hypothetical protein [Herbaspirillum sp. RTI4]